MTIRIGTIISYDDCVGLVEDVETEELYQFYPGSRTFLSEDEFGFPTLLPSGQGDDREDDIKKGLRVIYQIEGEEGSEYIGEWCPAYYRKALRHFSFEYQVTLTNPITDEIKQLHFRTLEYMNHVQPRCGIDGIDSLSQIQRVATVLYAARLPITGQKQEEGWFTLPRDPRTKIVPTKTLSSTLRNILIEFANALPDQKRAQALKQIMRYNVEEK